jgi:hypothetical protein
VSQPSIVNVKLGSVSKNVSKFALLIVVREPSIDEESQTYSEVSAMKLKFQSAGETLFTPEDIREKAVEITRGGVWVEEDSYYPPHSIVTVRIVPFDEPDTEILAG